MWLARVDVDDPLLRQFVGDLLEVEEQGASLEAALVLVLHRAGRQIAERALLRAG